MHLPPDSCNLAGPTPVIGSVETRPAGTPTEGSSRERWLRERLPDELAALQAYARRWPRQALPGLDPQDLVQETMERALRYAASLDPARPLQPWLRRVMLRVFLDRRAQRARQPEPLGLEPAGGERTAHEALAAREDVQRLLAQLEPLERELLQAFHGAGCSLAELAARHELPLGTVKSLLHRARRKLAARRGREERPHV